MTLDQLRVFVAVAELQHVTRAAQRLNMTQSSVSNAISTMEARHQVSLFHRVGRGIELTAEGAEFLESARAVLAQAKSAETTLSDLAGLKHGLLSIFASQTISNFWLPPHLVAYQERHPRVDLMVEIGNTAESVVAVCDGTAELGFIEGEIELPALHMDDVAADRLVLVVGRRHCWASAPLASPSDLLTTKWALREKGSGTRSSFENALVGYGISPADLQVVLQLPSNEALCAAVAAGELASVVPEAAVEAGVASGLLIKLPLDLGTRTFRMIRHRERRLSRSALAFVDMLPVSNPRT